MGLCITHSPKTIDKVENYMISYLLQQLLNGLSLGGAYALIAIGYTMVYGILRMINFAHGDEFMMAGYFMIFSLAVFPWYFAIPFVILCTIVLGVVII